MKRGRKPVVSDRENRKLIKLASNSHLSIKQIKTETRVNASLWTINRVLNNTSHIKKQKLQKCSKSTSSDKELRRKYARSNVQTDWKNF